MDIGRLSDTGLANFRAYWHRRLHCRGGSWLNVIMQTAALDMLAEIDAEIARRESVKVEPQP
jgi:hypothetical protein